MGHGVCGFYNIIEPPCTNHYKSRSLEKKQSFVVWNRDDDDKKIAVRS